MLRLFCRNDGTRCIAVSAILGNVPRSRRYLDCCYERLNDRLRAGCIKFHREPVRVIRWSAVPMAVGVGVTFFSPGGFIVIGAIAGCVMIAIMAALSGRREQQGILMGLFSTSSYLGMALLPFAAGLIADSSGFPWAFLVTALLALTVAFTIGRCSDLPAPAQRRKIKNNTFISDKRESRVRENEIKDSNFGSSDSPGL